MRLTNNIKSPTVYWLTQAILLVPLMLLWAGILYWYANKSAYLLKTVFGANGEGGIVVVVFSALSIVFGVWHLVVTSAENQFDWLASVGLCLFAALTLLILLGQMIS